MKRVLPLVLSLLATLPAYAFDLSGKAEQGGLMLGKAPPGAAITLDGRTVPVDAAGNFAIGFGRDAAKAARLVVNGEERILSIAPREWNIQRIDGLPPSKVTPDPKALARIREEAAMVAQRRDHVDTKAWFLSGAMDPAQGPRSGVFGSQRILNGEPRSPHSGTDIAAPAGSPVVAVADGVVSLAHPDMYFTGATVMIDHGLGVQTVYAHLSRMDVKEGQTVTKGQPIGAVGASGRATGPHLHWGASWLDVRLDPETVMQVLAR